MEKKNKKTVRKELPPYNIIKAATEGDVEAINRLLKHYESYITKLSTRIFYDEFGQPHYLVDEELCRRLETRLITKILTFDPKPL